MEPMDDDRERAGEDPAFKVNDRRWWVERDEADAPAGDAAPADDKPTFVAYLEKQLAERDQLLKEATDRQRRAIAELERAQERIARDAQRQLEQSTRDLIASLLPVLDDLDRALAAAREAGRDPALTEGVELARRRFLSTLADRGISRDEPLGERFNPARHEAVSIVPAPAGTPTNTILAVVHPGYHTAAALIRPALVAVSK